MSAPQKEVRELAEAMFDGIIDNKGLARLDELIVHDSSCRATYLELINLHGELFCQANFHSDEQAALGVLRDFRRAYDRQERRTRRRTITYTATSVLVFCSLFGWFFLTRVFQPVTLGSVAFLTNNARLRSGELELGHVLRTGKTLAIDEGIISLQLQNVLLDLIGPAELKLAAMNQVQLQQGTLTARVLPGGEGFTVKTPDAEVIDLGTEFLVRYDSREGTDVSVRRGRAQASLLNPQGEPVRMLELTAMRSAHLLQRANTINEIDFRPEVFQVTDESRGGIRSLNGGVRTTTTRQGSYCRDQVLTPNHLLIIPERQNVQLDANLVLNGIEGSTRIPAGSVVSSYLIHFDPGREGIFAPRGSITFFGTIAAVVGRSPDLAATDARFGLEETVYETAAFRGLELDADEIRLSDDRQTLGFFFGVSPPHYLDEARIFVVTSAP